MTFFVVIGAVVVLVVVAAGVVVAMTRRSHLRSWRFGVFYEGEERIDRDD